MRGHVAGIARSIVSCLIAWGFAAGAVSAQTNVMFIFDASGSMVTPVAGANDTRIGIAKKAMQKLLSEMPADAHLGLMMYGHRRARDCTDLELVSPLGADDAAKINKTIQAVQPKGETPIAVAIREAARSFTMLKGQNNSIVLVTDGIEECHGDPCAAANEVRVQGLSLKVDIVGFTLNDAQRKLIQCVPDATGGKFFEAKDLPSLTAALGEVRQRATQAPAAPPPPPPPAEFNLLAPANGGHVIAAPNADWTKIISTNDADEIGAAFPQEAIFAFKDNGLATFDTFAILIASNAGGNPQDFELQAADDVGGPYKPLGTFKTQNLRMLQDPYQRFKLPETTAKYLKVRFISGYGATGAGGFQRVPQIRLIGKLGGSTTAAAPAASTAASEIVNLLSPSNGGQLIAAPSAQWTAIISGKESDELGAFMPTEAVFGFRDDKPATFDTFKVLIASNAGGNPAEIELSAADDLKGPFRSLGTFKPQNLRLISSPYQEFKFPQATARYLKARFVSGYGATGAGGFQRVPQVQLFGKLDASAAAPARPAPPAGQVNLLSPANGGQLLAAPDPGWTKLISGNDADMVSATLPQEALFAFKDEKPAIFSRFAVLIPGDGGGLPKDIELQASDQIGGPFRSLGIFTTLHARVIRDPYQEFAFPETTAKYVKVKFISGYGATGAGGFQGLTQIRLIGALK